MKPAPAISALAISGDFGSSFRISCASSRGFFFSGRASCIAALLEKSPCEAFFGRSISRLTGASGATVSRAVPISSAIWSLSGWVLGMVDKGRDDLHFPVLSAVDGLSVQNG